MSSRVLCLIQDGRPEPIPLLAHQHTKSDSDIVSFATGTCLTPTLLKTTIKAKKPDKLTMEWFVRLPKCRIYNYPRFNNIQTAILYRNVGRTPLDALVMPFV